MPLCTFLAQLVNSIGTFIVKPKEIPFIFVLDVIVVLFMLPSISLGNAPLDATGVTSWIVESLLSWENEGKSPFATLSFLKESEDFPPFLYEIPIRSLGLLALNETSNPGPLCLCLEGDEIFATILVTKKCGDVGLYNKRVTPIETPMIRAMMAITNKTQLQ